MITRFTEKVRFNQLEEGDLFTFRKNGILTGHPDDELLRYDDWGKSKANVLCYGGAWFTIKNTRSWVWRVPNGNSSRSCNGCKYEWAVPSHEMCQGCARMYTDNYSRKEM